MLDRLITKRLQRSTKSLLLLGPRQVGKSTLAKTLSPIRSYNLLDENTFLSLAKDPSQLAREIIALPKSQHRSLVLIDEVQRVPNLLNTVQLLIDEHPACPRFLLTGSSARKLKMRGTNLLPGRVILEYLDPLTYWELKIQFDLNRALQLGMLPGIYLGDSESVDVLGTYSKVYLKEEIQAEALTRNIGSFARFLDVASIMSGHWINYTKISSDTEIPKETIRRYFALLEDTLLIFRIPAFAPRTQKSRRVIQKEKLLWFDVGVRNAILGLHSHAVTPDQKGTLFEQWCMLQILYLNRAMHLGWTISAYRTHSGAEVDLVIEREKDILGVEIKASRNVGPSDTKGLLSLAQDVHRYKPLKKLIVFLGDRPQRLDHQIDAIPYLTFLEDLPSV